MLGSRMAFGAFAALLLSALFGCGGTAEHGGPNAAGGSGGGAFSAGASHTGGGSSSPGRGGAGAAGVAGSHAGKPVVDPEPVETGCPEREPLPPDLQCDPFTANSCGAGLGCYPFVEHPDGDCEQQHYGTLCAPAGVRRQGEACGGDDGDCAPGFVCVVGQRAGKRCSPLCQLGKPNTCTGGLLCGDLDVAGFGVCG